ILEKCLAEVGDFLLRDRLDDSSATPVRHVAGAKILTALRRLDGSRKGILLRFLSESHLIDRGRPIIDLAGADLCGADLHEANLRSIDMRGANLSGANLRGADLNASDLSATWRSPDDKQRFQMEADPPKFALRRTVLREADMREVWLSGSDLSGADLRNADL